MIDKRDSVSESALATGSGIDCNEIVNIGVNATYLEGGGGGGGGEVFLTAYNK
jgi:hypothetical protein